jgi:hypothetical protein
VSFNENISNNKSLAFFELFYLSFVNFVKDTIFIAKKQSLFLGVFSCSALFLLAWIMDKIFYVPFVLALLVFVSIIWRQQKLLLIKKDFEENGIF